MIPAEVLKNIKKIEIKTRNIINTVLAGQYNSVFRGQGMEFSEVRSYMDGDDIRNIDWNVTARTGSPHVKKFVEERELTIMLMVDFSGSQDFGTRKRLKTETIAELSALLAFSAIRNNDKVGLIIFTSDVELFIPPQKGKKHVLHLIRELLFFEPQNTTTNISQAIQHLNKVLRKKAIVFCLSDFKDNKDYFYHIKTTAGKHDFIPVIIKDPAEFEIPDMGLVTLKDAESGKEILVDTSSKEFRKLYKKESDDNLEKIRIFFAMHGIDYMEMFTNEDYVDILLKFFARRKKALST